MSYIEVSKAQVLKLAKEYCEDADSVDEVNKLLKLVVAELKAFDVYDTVDIWKRLRITIDKQIKYVEEGSLL